MTENSLTPACNDSYEFTLDCPAHAHPQFDLGLEGDKFWLAQTAIFNAYQTANLKAEEGFLWLQFPQAGLSRRVWRPLPHSLDDQEKMEWRGKKSKQTVSINSDISENTAYRTKRRNLIKYELRFHQRPEQKPAAHSCWGHAVSLFR